MLVEAITGPIARHGEGVIWDSAEGLVRWVDMLAGDVLSIAPGKSETHRFHAGRVVTALRPRRHGGLVLGMERGFALLDAEFTQEAPVVELWSDPSVRMNDGGCDPAGRFFCGSMAYDGAFGRGRLYRLDPDGTVTTVLRGVTISNGIAWTPDGGMAYYIDSFTQCIDAFDYDVERGKLTGRRVVAEIPERDGTPDGMTIDADGFLWVAIWGGGAVRRYAPNGRLDGVIQVPARLVTACSFGGPNLDELYITTSRLDLGEEAEPLAGALFRCRPGTRGPAPHLFAG